MPPRPPQLHREGRARLRPGRPSRPPRCTGRAPEDWPGGIGTHPTGGGARRGGRPAPCAGRSRAQGRAESRPREYEAERRSCSPSTVVSAGIGLAPSEGCGTVAERYGERVVSFDPIPSDCEGLLFRGSGSMNYPEAEMRFIWDGRGTVGASADCIISHEGIRLRPKKLIRSLQGWPELVLPLEEIRGVERMFFGRYRFRCDCEALDGACFRPIGSKDAFLAAVQRLRIPIIHPSKRDRVAFERRTVWNQMRWGGRLRRRHWKQERREGAAD